jgi:hypothetical protein
LIDEPPPGVLDVLEGDDLEEGFLGGTAFNWGELEGLMADRLVRDFSIDHITTTAALSQHLQGRLDAVRANLNEIAAYYGGARAP